MKMPKMKASYRSCCGGYDDGDDGGVDADDGGGAVDDDSPGRGWALPTQPWWEEKQLTLMFPAHGNASHFPAYCLNKTDFGQQALIFLMIAAKLFWHMNFRNATFWIASLGSE